jgi:hypothetical protein
MCNLRNVSTYIYLPRETLQGIFQPLVTNISDLVKSQVDSVRIKRMEENHVKSKEIKVRCLWVFGKDNPKHQLIM